jgi:hypothetical protein
MSNEKKLDVIRNYMSSQFSGFAIDCREEPTRYRYELRKDKSLYVILVLKEFVDAFGAEQIETQLVNYSVGTIARSLGDFPILVTTSGCIFDRDAH